jgi:mannose/fructose-specific phosphotransferase system component IIA
LRALILTHGRLGEALVESAGRILVDPPSIDTMSNDDASGAELMRRVRDWADAEPGPVVVFVDVGGGSCGTAAQLALRERPQSWIFGGVNLPMVLTFLGTTAGLRDPELIAKILDRGLNSVRILGDESGR